MSDDDLTPTQDLVLEVLIARHRLGEQLWTFDSRLRRTVDQLAEFGLVIPMSGITERTVRATLTEEAKERWITGSSYVPPILREQMTDYVEHLQVLPARSVVLDPTGLVWQLLEHASGELMWFCPISPSSVEKCFGPFDHADLIEQRGRLRILHRAEPTS